MKAAQKAYEVVRGKIIDGEFAPGDRITEAEIAETASVSRTPVREALHRLEAEGLIRFVANQGAFVSSCGTTEAEDIFQMRAMLESYAARLCAERASDEQIALLKLLAADQYEASQRRDRGSIEKIADLNSRFHELVLDAADSDLLRASMAALSNAPLVFQTFREYSHEDLLRSAQHHREFTEAVEQRNADWAAAVMRAHIFAARSVFLKHLESDTDTEASVSAVG